MKSANMMPISLKETGLKATRKVREMVINHGCPLKLSRLTTVVRDLCPVRSSTLEIICFLGQPLCQSIVRSNTVSCKVRKNTHVSEYIREIASLRIFVFTANPLV